ncbi:MAG: LD-carboxypeptidase, partial [Enterobacterales bacterium]|nr:LD-carboxypeptidase [Enterobacterales bacterium]
HLFERRGYLAGMDKQRAADVNAMFEDKSVDGIFCLRGGYGSPRILPYLIYDTIRNNPKAIIGYSDVTALLNAIYAKTGLITFHGPIAGQRFSDYTVASFKKVLFEPQANIKLAEAPPFEEKEGWVERDNRLTTIVPGKAQGRLIGGSLTLMAVLVGTPYEPDYRGKILFLEDVSEAPYKVDRMLTHLTLAGRLQQVAGVVFGKCTKCGSSGNSLSMEQVLYDHLEPLGIPVVRGAMIGHIDDMATIPIGAKAEINTADGPINLLEKAVG